MRWGRTVHSARVLGLDWSGGVAVCSLQKTLLAGVLWLDELAIGQRLTTTVKQFVKQGLLVDVGPHLTGLVPWMFLTDVPLKHPERKFFPGDKLLHLTSKPILHNEEFNLVASFEVELNIFFLFFIKFYFLGGCGWKID